MCLSECVCVFLIESEDFRRIGEIWLIFFHNEPSHSVITLIHEYQNRQFGLCNMIESHVWRFVNYIIFISNVIKMNRILALRAIEAHKFHLTSGFLLSVDIFWMRVSYVFETLQPSLHHFWAQFAYSANITNTKSQYGPKFK